MTIKTAQRMRDGVLATIVIILVATLILLSGCSSPTAPENPIEINLSTGVVDTLEGPTDFPQSGGGGWGPHPDSI